MLLVCILLFLLLGCFLGLLLFLEYLLLLLHRIFCLFRVLYFDSFLELILSLLSFFFFKLFALLSFMLDPCFLGQFCLSGLLSFLLCLLGSSFLLLKLFEFLLPLL